MSMRMTAGNASGSRSLQDMQEEVLRIRQQQGMGSVDEAALTSEISRVKSAGGPAVPSGAVPSSGMTAGQGAAAAQLGVQGLQAAGMGDGSQGSTTGGVASGAASGAAMGSMIMPGWGTAIGAVAGGTMGALKAKSARKKMRAEAKAAEEEEKSKIMGDKEARVQKAMQSMAANMGATLRSVG